MITDANITSHEFIKTKKGFKMFPKNHSHWKFNLLDNEITLSGSLLEKRSFERQGSKL